VSDTPGAPAPSQGAAELSRQLLAAEDVFALSSLELRARVVADGVLVGAHRSRRFGSSTEFAEHKLYAPGDELKHIDWKAYARMDRYFVRRYEEETNLDITLLVDASGSMAYAGGARGAFHHSKLDYAATLAAACCWLAMRRSDAPGLTVFAAGEQARLPPRARRDDVQEIFRVLETADAGGPTQVGAVLSDIAKRLQRSALVIFVSDLLDVSEEVLEPLGVLRKRGADVLLLHTLDADELEFPFDGVVRFTDLEGDREVQVDAPGVREAYLEEVKAFLERVRTGCARRDLRYSLAPTGRAPAEVLREALAGTALLRGGRK
jgi:uncharacterized protein (DUF58 family)